MNETSIGFALVWRLIRHRWVVLLVLAVLGAGVGAALSLVLSPGYVSTAKVLLQGARTPTEVPGEAEIATSLVVLDNTADDLKLGIPGSALVSRVSAEIAGGNVLVISGSAATPQAAQQLTDKVTAEYISFATQIISDAANAASAANEKARSGLQEKIDDANKKITELQASPAVTAPGPDGDTARAAMQAQQRVVADATQGLSEIEAASKTSSLNEILKGANARVIQMATLPTAMASPTLLQIVLGAATAFALLGVLAHLIGLRVDKRLHHAQDMAAALGAPVLSVVGRTPRKAVQRSWLPRLLRDDRRWAADARSVVDDDRGRSARYHRVLHRLPAAPVAVLALVPVGDALAMDALVDLAVAAADGPLPAALVTDDEALAERALAEAENHGLGSRLSASADLPEGDALTIVAATVGPSQPIVPETEATDGVLLLAGVRTRTSWELVGIAGACADSGQPLLGLVAVVPTGVADEDAGRTRTPDAVEAGLAGTA